jgi:hypothetical protein
MQGARMNTSAIDRAALQSLYLTSSADLVKVMPDVADRLHAQIHEALREPTPGRCERLSLELDGARRHVLKIREALVREASGHVPDGGR